ncbi:M28 family peptidase [Muriicola sp. Z0-33]|uniref:M28 family peptidase n=1 Tax=Muriicola sp. Z0-33 TaxID=2816957 RepID=UPI0022374892|nr:M28 family peptidase [Muriicola sp. Z0-33]MCW5514710.1 M28 family peptidase [Muriicola sp. Z0-33]
MKKIILPIFFIIALACKKESGPKVTINEDVAFLASDSLEGRETGTANEIKAADYLQQRMSEIGLQPKGKEDTYFQTFSFKSKRDPHQEIEYSVSGDSTITGTNVIGFLDNQATSTIVIGAHYDHLGLGGEGSLYRGETAIHNGADDNASGVALLLSLAYELKENNTGNNYLFIAFSGEEMGLLGSNYFTKNPTVDISEINYMINMDMVGRLRKDSTLSVSGTGTSPIWNQVLNASNTDFKLVLKPSGVGPSDHTSFYLQDIPVLHFFTGQHEDYHKPSDDAEKLNYKGMEMISDYIMAVIGELDDDGELVFKKTKNESEEVPRFKVALGVIPDYLFDGKGMRIDGISEDKPAQKARLQKGDVVIQLGDSTVVDMMSYMRALSVFDIGDVTKVIVDRNGEKIEAEITF